MSKTSTILAIETSCDETGVAIVQKKSDITTVVSSALASQIDIHTETGGVVPEIAAREHVVALQTLIPKVIEESGISPADFDAIAVTVGPGLPPALMTGVTAARTLALAWQKPIIPIHHIEGHIYSALLHSSDTKTYSLPENSFPALALIVSGGHTLLLHIEGHSRYTTIGTTLDDAAGEAFDKVARLLGLPYPGGPHLSKLAEHGNPTAIPFPRPMLKSGDLNFSFSGLKTSVLYVWRDLSENDKEIQQADIAASFQAAVVDSLVIKVKRALKAYPVASLLLAGGVAANTRLRSAMNDLATKHTVPLRIAPLSLCGDNAIMIGLAAVYTEKRTTDWKSIQAQSRLSLDAFSRLSPDLNLVE